MKTQPRLRLSHMWQLYITLLGSTLVFACALPILALYLLGLHSYEYVVVLCASATLILAANLTIFFLVRNRARAMLDNFIEKTNPFFELPEKFQNARPSMEVDTIEDLFSRVVGKLHETIKGRLRSEREGMLASIASLIAALESRDRYTQNHSARVAALSGKIANELGLAKQEIDNIKLAALLHDVGKIGIRDAVLLKEDKLTDAEYAIIKAHPRISGEILRPIKGLKHVIEIIVHHHERPDGKGYPDGLREGEASIGAFIVAVADAYDAMTIDRPYRAALPPDKVISELVLQSGTQFHVKCVDAILNALAKEGRLGLPVALTSSAWSKVEREAATAFGHTWDDGAQTDDPDALTTEERLRELERLTEALAESTPEPADPEPTTEEPLFRPA